MRRMLLLLGAVVVAAASAVLVTGVSRSPESWRSVDACRWRVVSTGAKVPVLGAVAAISPTDVWAVGGTSDTGYGGRPMIAHWDGSRLRVVQAFRPSSVKEGGEMAAVAAVGANDVWAVGADGERAVAMHWNGKAWRRMAVPASVDGLGDVIAFSTSDIWATGWSQIIHWDGRSWRVYQVPVADPPGGVVAIDWSSPALVDIC